MNFERFRQNFADLVENLVGRRIDYAQFYPADVVAQNADGTLQVLPDDEKIRGTGLDRVPIRHGLPGTSVVVSQGAKVRVGFEAGDPGRPYAGLWDTDAAFVTITLAGGTQSLARQGDLVQSGGAGTSLILAGVGPASLGVPYPVSFSINPADVGPLAKPLFGAISTGQPKVKA